MKKFLVTGANGFVGRAVCRNLLAHGFQVRAALRNPAAAPVGTEAVRIEDIGPGSDWRAALAGVEGVIHLAARVHVMREEEADPLAAFRYVNSFGTRTLAEQAAAAGAQRFIFLSTIKVNGEATAPGHPFTAWDQPQPEDAYGRSKYEAEEGLRGLALETGLKVAVIRPPLVYGPGVKGNFLQLLRLAMREWPLPLGAIENRRSLVYVETLADLVRTCAEEGAPLPFEIFLVRDGEDLSTPELVRRLTLALGKKARFISISERMLALAGRLSGRSGVIERLTGSLTVDDGPTRERLDWQPPFSVDQGLSETALWFRHLAGRDY